MSENDEKPPEAKGADVVSIEDARRRADEKAQAAEQTPPPSGEPSPTVQAVLQPIMAAVLKELQGLAGPDGVVKLGGEDEAARAKTAAVLRGIGAGLGAALADAFGRWAQKITVTTTETPPATPDGPKPDSPTTTPPPPDNTKPN